MTDEPPSSYAVKLRPYSDKYSHTTPGEYLEIPIPDEIEQFGFEHGDTVYMDFASADDPPYIRIRFSDTGTRHDLKLKYRDDRYPRHAVTFPTEYTVTRDDSPFQGFGRDKTVTVEFSYGSEPEMRIYTEEGYRKRTAELVSDDLTPTLKAPSLASLFNIFSTSPDINLAEKTGIRGGRFEFIPFDPLELESNNYRSLLESVEDLYSDSKDSIEMSDVNIWFKDTSEPDSLGGYDFARSDTFDGSYRAFLSRDERTNVYINKEGEKSVLTLYREDGAWVVEVGDNSVKKPVQLKSSSSGYNEIFVPLPVNVEGGPEFEYIMYLR